MKAFIFYFSWENRSYNCLRIFLIQNYHCGNKLFCSGPATISLFEMSLRTH